MFMPTHSRLTQTHLKTMGGLCYAIGWLYDRKYISMETCGAMHTALKSYGPPNDADGLKWPVGEFAARATFCRRMAEMLE